MDYLNFSNLIDDREDRPWYASTKLDMNMDPLSLVNDEIHETTLGMVMVRKNMYSYRTETRESF